MSHANSRFQPARQSTTKRFLIAVLTFFIGTAHAQEKPMSDVDAYIFHAIKVAVWGGFNSQDEVQGIITDLLEEGADEALLRKQVNLEFAKKAQAETTWPAVTDYNRLDQAFAALRRAGVLCLHNAGYTLSDGHDDANEALQEYPPGTFYGYCFYHGQDLERALDGEGLMVAYDHVEGDVPDKLKVARAVKTALEQAGFAVQWDGTTDQRINIPVVDWKHRGADN